jgi:hypothetical protein
LKKKEETNFKLKVVFNQFKTFFILNILFSSPSLLHNIPLKNYIKQKQKKKV